MKKLACILTSAVLLLLLAACGVKNEARVALRCNALAGYMWRCVTADTGCIEYVGEDYVSGDSLCTLGKSGTYSFRYAPKEPGTVTLSYEYYWIDEEDVAVLTASCAFTVDDEGVITWQFVEAPDYPDGMY